MPVLKNVKSKEEWITPGKALRLLAPVFGSEYEAKITICKRAYAGLIRARAEQYMTNDAIQNNVAIPREFWSEEGGGSFGQNWTTGDFETYKVRGYIDELRFRAFNVSFYRPDIEDMIPADFVPTTKSAAAKAVLGTKVFIGHGGSPQWRELKEFIKDELHLPVDEFNTEPAAGMQTVERNPRCWSKRPLASWS